MNAETIAGLDDRTLVEVHDLMHRFWQAQARRDDDTSVVGEHSLVVIELAKRRIFHHFRDDLDKKAGGPSDPVEVIVDEKYPSLRVRDPAGVADRLRSGSSVGLLARTPKNARVGKKQALMKRGGGSLVWAIVTLKAADKFESLRDLTKPQLHGIEREDLSRFANAKAFWYHQLESVKTYSRPVKLVRRSPGHRRYGPRVDLAGATESPPSPAQTNPPEHDAVDEDQD
jgi:hypothetical protein